MKFTSIDIEFSDKNFHRNFRANDDFNACMAIMNYTGLVTASRLDQIDLDEYEDDLAVQKEDEVDKKYSYIYFKPFDERKSSNGWHFKMQDHESIEAIAQGSSWVACSTDAGYLRIFSTDGIQKYVMHYPSMVVSMTGYENLLAIFYHAGLPIMGHQQLKCRIIDTNTYKTVFDDFAPVSKHGDLIWVGFSDEGMLITLDNMGVISGFDFRNSQWIPLLDLKNKFPETYHRVWVVGFMENSLMYIELAKDQIQPHESLKSKYKRLELHVPMLEHDSEVITDKKEQNLNDLEELHFREHIMLDHEQYRKDVWEPLKLFRGRYDNERFLSESIMDAKQIVQKKKELDKHILNAIRLCVVNDEHDKVFTYLDLLNFT